MAITRFTVEWSGIPGAPGYTNFFVDGAVADSGAAAAIAVSIMDFFTAINADFPDDLELSIQPQAVVVDEASGNMTGIVPFATPAVVSGQAGQPYAGPSGAVVHWMTSEFRAGRLVRGKTFLVPLVSIAFDGAGTLATNTQSRIQTAGETLLGDLITNPLVVWSRPSAGGSGASSVVSSVVVPDLAAVLRSRRD